MMFINKKIKIQNFSYFNKDNVINMYKYMKNNVIKQIIQADLPSFPTWNSVIHLKKTHNYCNKTNEIKKQL